MDEESLPPASSRAMLSRLMLKFYRALLEFLRLRRDDALLLPHIDSSRAGDDTAAPPASDRR